MDTKRFRVFETYEIWLRSGKEFKFLCYARIENIRHFKLHNLSDFMAWIDTGYSLQECTDIIMKMYKNKNINWSTQYLSFILLVKETKPKPVISGQYIPEKDSEIFLFMKQRIIEESI
jgi:hypothetical protein